MDGRYVHTILHAGSVRLEGIYLAACACTHAGLSLPRWLSLCRAARLVPHEDDVDAAMPDEPSQVWPVVRFSTGLMAVLGVLDGLADEAWPLALRAAWKVALSCSGVYFNVQNFADGRFANRSHLVAYIAAILATALYALKTR